MFRYSSSVKYFKFRKSYKKIFTKKNCGRKVSIR